jgi:hypothetical protein
MGDNLIRKMADAIKRCWPGSQRLACRANGGRRGCNHVTADVTAQGRDKSAAFDLPIWSAGLAGNGCLQDVLNAYKLFPQGV